MRGSVKFFNKGWGFIKPEGGGRDIFVHYTGILTGDFKTLEPNEEVEFELQESERGPKAVSVRRLNVAAQQAS